MVYQGRGEHISSMINKDLLAGMRIEMKSLGVYVPKPAEADEPAPPPPAPKDDPDSAAPPVPAAAAAVATDGDSATPSAGTAANGTDVAGATME